MALSRSVGSNDTPGGSYCMLRSWLITLVSISVSTPSRVSVLYMCTWLYFIHFLIRIAVPPPSLSFSRFVPYIFYSS